MTPHPGTDGSFADRRLTCGFGGFPHGDRRPRGWPVVPPREIPSVLAKEATGAPRSESCDLRIWGTAGVPARVGGGSTAGPRRLGRRPIAPDERTTHRERRFSRLLSPRNRVRTRPCRRPDVTPIPLGHVGARRADGALGGDEPRVRQSVGELPPGADSARPGSVVRRRCARAGSRPRTSAANGQYRRTTNQRRKESR